MVYVHDTGFLKYADSKEAYDVLHKSVKSMVGCALEIYKDNNILENIKQEFIKN